MAWYFLTGFSSKPGAVAPLFPCRKCIKSSNIFSRDENGGLFHVLFRVLGRNDADSVDPAPGEKVGRPGTGVRDAGRRSPSHLMYPVDQASFLKGLSFIAREKRTLHACRVTYLGPELFNKASEPMEFARDLRGLQTTPAWLHSIYQ